jgi:CBS domain-containing protein
MSKVKDIMITKVESCTPETDLSAAGGKMWENDCGTLPVLDNDGKVLGVITDRDICIAAATRNQPASHIKVGDVYSGMLYSCVAEDEIEKALQIMRTARVRRLPVINGEGKLEGLLALDDVTIFAQDASVSKVAEPTYKDVALTFKNICGRREIEVRKQFA